MSAARRKPKVTPTEAAATRRVSDIVAGISISAIKEMAMRSARVPGAVSLLEDARVTVTPGSAFGPRGEHHVRMAYCVCEDSIERAFDRIEQHFGSS